MKAFRHPHKLNACGLQIWYFADDNFRYNLLNENFCNLSSMIYGFTVKFPYGYETLNFLVMGLSWWLPSLNIPGMYAFFVYHLERHYSDVIMSATASQITGVSIVCSGTDRRKHQSSASLAFVRGIHRPPVNSPHKGPVSRKMFPFDDVIIEFSEFKLTQRIISMDATANLQINWNIIAYVLS